MGLEYAVLDRILWRLEQGTDAGRIATDLGLPDVQVRYVVRLVQRAAVLRATGRVPVGLAPGPFPEE